MNPFGRRRPRLPPALQRRRITGRPECPFIRIPTHPKGTNPRAHSSYQAGKAARSWIRHCDPMGLQAQIIALPQEWTSSAVWGLSMHRAVRMPRQAWEPLGGGSHPTPNDPEVGLRCPWTRRMALSLNRSTGHAGGRSRPLLGQGCMRLRSYPSSPGERPLQIVVRSAHN